MDNLKDALMIEVIDGRSAGRESFITLIGTLSIPGTLFVDIALIIRSTCSRLTVEWKTKFFRGWIFLWDKDSVLIKVT